MQNELIELASQCPNDDRDTHVICHKDFRDEFNPRAKNNTNNSATLHALSLLPLDSDVDSIE